MAHPASPDASPNAQSASTAEQRRLDALHALAVLDTLPEPLFDAISAAAAQACGVPIALVTLVDAERQWFKSNIGLPGLNQTARHVAFCDHAIRGDSVFEIPDAEQDARFADNPLVTAEPYIRFYAGAPIVMPGGAHVGTVCVIDREPRQLSEAQRSALEGLGRIASVALSERRRLVATARELAVSEARYRAIVEDQSELIALVTPDGTLSFVNAACARHHGLAVAQMVGRQLFDFVDEADREAAAALRRKLPSAGQPLAATLRLRSAGGEPRWIAWTLRSIADAGGQTVQVHAVGRDITEQHLAEGRLQDALREKETLLKEVYHRVKNNLQVVQSLLGLQQRSVADESARLALAESARRVRAMALVHEKLYQSGSLATVSLRDYMQDLLRQIEDAAGTADRGIRLQTDIDDLASGLDGAIPFGLLITELVFNAIEHAFAGREQGRIHVTLKQFGARRRLTVADDGVGLAEGFELAAVGSMGLQLAAALAAQLGGELVARNEGGACFSAELSQL